MKIKRITLFNIGPYVDMNTFDFSISNNKNIVLIGGKNGAGKTTFFKAIKTCLYGCKVWGFDAPGKEYYSIIAGLVNSKSLYDSSASAYIEIELYFNDGKQINIYTLHREWKKNKQTYTEYFHIKKNDILIIGQEENDFVNYLLSVIPPDMFNLFFFDGESIAEFFLGAEGNKNFRNAFLKLYGLDTLSIMVENFARNIKNNVSQNSVYADYLSEKQKYEKEEESFEKLQDAVAQAENKIDLLQIKLRSLQAGYKKDGGVSLSEWKEINSFMIKEESNRDNINRWLKDIANHYLPFIIIEKQLSALLIELQHAQENERNEIILDSLSEPIFIEKITSFLLNKNDNIISAIELITFIKEMIDFKAESIRFDFSIGQLNRIISQIIEKQEFDKKQIKQTITKLNSSLKKSKQLRDKLNTSSIDGYENFVEEKESIEKQISESLLFIERTRQEIAIQSNVVEMVKKNQVKARDRYEELLKNKSISSISERAAVAYSLVEEELVKRQAKLLQEEFIKCFNSMINKNSFIDGIVIDKKINVIPYKYIRVASNQLNNYMSINKEFLSFFNNFKYIEDINKLQLGKARSIKLPSPIKAPFSQGERQVYIMAIYLALLKTSRKDIPFFIDTPFARIDSNHRANIISEFFMKLSNQIFILSTDEEIIGEYKDMIANKVSDEFLLEISAYGSTKIVNDKYFGE